MRIRKIVKALLLVNVTFDGFIYLFIRTMEIGEKAANGGDALVMVSLAGIAIMLLVAFVVFAQLIS